MDAERIIYDKAFSGRLTVSHLLLITLLGMFVFLSTFLGTSYAETVQNRTVSPLPERTREPGQPTTWVSAANSGELRFGAVSVVVPSGFTRQSGADIRANGLLAVNGLVLPSNVVTGTVIALGIWPPNDQVEFDRVFEVRLLIDAVVLSQVQGVQLQFVQYDPERSSWLPLDSVFRPGTYELIVKVKSFTPVAKNFPTWGGRTFFVVVRSTSEFSSHATSNQPTVLRGANIRSGPGTSFQIVRTVKSGATLILVGNSADGQWLQLDDGSWIAAFLVAGSSQLPVVNDD